MPAPDLGSSTVQIGSKKMHNREYELRSELEDSEADELKSKITSKL